MRIQQARIENFMGIKLLDIKLDDDDAVVQFAGSNGQGKSSAALAIIGALGGKGALAKAMGLSKDPGDDEIIRRGEEMSEVEVKFDGWVVNWTRKRGGAEKVEIRDSGGGAHGRKKLQSLIGDLTFDPMELDRMPPAERREMLLKMAGVDLEEIDLRYDATYLSRRDVNRDHKLSLARVGQAIPGAPEEEVDTLRLAGQHKKAAAQITRNSSERYEANVLKIKSDGARKIAGTRADHLSEVFALAGTLASHQDEEVAAMSRRHEAEVASMRDSVAESEAAKAETEEASRAADVASSKALATTSKLVDPELEPIVDALDSGREANERYRLAQARLGRQTEAEKLGAASRKLTEELAKIDAEKVALLASAKMPIDNLGVSDDDATIGGHLWHTASTSERLRVCVAISAALSPELKVAFVRGGNDFDDATCKVFEAECKNRGLQAWIERGKVAFAGAIVIESGKVKP